MLTDDQVHEQCKLIKKMLEVSPYYINVDVIVYENEEKYTVFSIGSSEFIEVRWSKTGNHHYLPGYENIAGGFGSEPPSKEEVYLGARKLSYHQACVRLVTHQYESALHVAFEQDEPEESKSLIEKDLFLWPVIKN